MFGYIQNSICGNFGGRRIGFANRRRGLAPSAAGTPRARATQPSQRIHFGAKNGTQANKGSKRIKHTRKSPSSVTHKKNEPPMRGSLTLPEFVLPKPKLHRFGAMILELKTGRKRSKGSKRIEHTQNSTVIRHPQKNEPPMRGSLTLPEFVPKTKGSRFGAMILEIKTGCKRNGGLKRIGIRGTQLSSVPHKKTNLP